MEYRQRLDLAVRLAAMSNEPHGVARTVLLYHEQLYHILEGFQGCASCQTTITTMKQAIGPLQARCSSFQERPATFQQHELKQLMRETITILDLSTWCLACRSQFQEQQASIFSAQLQQFQPATIHYHVRPKKRGGPQP